MSPPIPWFGLDVWARVHPHHRCIHATPNHLPGRYMGTVEDLLAESVGTRPNGRPQCWALDLEGDARDYMTALEDQPVADVYQARVVEILAQLGYQVSAGQVSDHLHRKCKCPR